MTLPVEQRREWIRSRREQRKLTRRARLHRQSLRYLLLACLLAAGVGSFVYLPWSLHELNGQIEVRNNKVVSDDQVRQALKDVVDQPLYQLDPRKLEDKVTELSVVKQAFVRRYALPQRRLIVEVLEEFPWASFGTNPDEPTKSVICESGRIISVAEFPKVVQPELKVYGPANLDLSAKDVSQWATWINLIAKQTNYPVQSVDMRDLQNVTVQDGDLCLRLGSPDTTLTRRLSRLSSLQTAIEPLKERLEYIDLGLDNNIPLKIAKKADNAKFLREKLNSRL
jgi:cell division septal protein FtsQ